MVILEAISYLLVAAGGTAVVLMPRSQATGPDAEPLRDDLDRAVPGAPGTRRGALGGGRRRRRMPLMILVAVANVRRWIEAPEPTEPAATGRRLA